MERKLKKKKKTIKQTHRSMEQNNKLRNKPMHQLINDEEAKTIQWGNNGLFNK